jgi:hypothetical protein
VQRWNSSIPISTTRARFDQVLQAAPKDDFVEVHGNQMLGRLEQQDGKESSCYNTLRKRYRQDVEASAALPLGVAIPKLGGQTERRTKTARILPCL